MLPAHLPDYPGLDLATGYLPAKEVGGDFYDLFTTPDNRLMITMADTSGKGISACMYSLSIRSMIRAYFSYGLPLTEVIKNTNLLFAKDAENTGIFVTAWFGLYDEKTKTLEYTSAGHYPAFLRKENGELIELNTKGIALGVEKTSNIQTQTVTLSKNDVLFLYTDGVIDAVNPSDEFFGTKRLKELIQRSHNLPSKQIVKSLLNEIKGFSEMTAQFDDITVLSIRVI
jgi:sigma-B regulation protein RsbU (phosphoserine phosphatase)